MKNENSKKKHLNINAEAIKNVVKSKEVRKAAKDALKAVKGVINTFDINN